jgi:hypothetical protein
MAKDLLDLGFIFLKKNLWNWSTDRWTDSTMVGFRVYGLHKMRVIKEGMKGLDFIV